jgi:hypothetical protein
METNYLRWNLPNWITVFLMVSVGYVLIGFASSAWKQYGKGS